MESMDLRQLYILKDKVLSDPNHGSSVVANNLQDDSDAEHAPPPVEDVLLDESTASVGSGGKDMGGDNDSVNSNMSSQKLLVHSETVTVSRLRVTVLVLLVVLMVAVPAALYVTRRKAETNEFQAHYDAAAEQLIESFENIVHQMGAIASIGVQLTSDSMNNSHNSTNTAWPYLSMDNFHRRVAVAMELPGVLQIGVAHLVGGNQFAQWDAFVQIPENYAWMNETYDYQKQLGVNDFESASNIGRSRITENRVVDVMHTFDQYGHPMDEEDQSTYYMPSWQEIPLLKTNTVNENLLHRHNFADAMLHLHSTKNALFGNSTIAPPGDSNHHDPVTSKLATLLSIKAKQAEDYMGEPVTQVYFPVFDQFDTSRRRMVAVLTATLQWRKYLENILAVDVNDMVVVLHRDSIGQEDSVSYSYKIKGTEVKAGGVGDQHNSNFNDFEREGKLVTAHVADGTLEGVQVDSDRHRYRIRVYPDQSFYDEYSTNTPILVALGMAVALFVLILLFAAYDRTVERRQKMLLNSAAKSNAIVSSLFPEKVKARLMEDANATEEVSAGSKEKLKKFLDRKPRLTNLVEKEGIHSAMEMNDVDAPPIADLFPDCTVFFADIAGFTAWSSTREPSAVFMLLQTAYRAFDKIAKRRRVFKVETIGDSYLAITGCPEPMRNHASVCARFASDILREFHQITRELENSLGPDTSEMSMRVGLHSGPVTAGVLRGDRARFQLFGDTVNTASRMESTGVRGKIQVSEMTAHLLQKSGKEHWLEPREDMIKAKGKGVLQTWWVTPSNAKMGGNHSSQDSLCSDMYDSDPDMDVDVNACSNRLVNWVTELLLVDIRKIVSRRVTRNIQVDPDEDLIHKLPTGKTCMDEVTEVISMPVFDSKAAAANVHAERMEPTIAPVVVEQLKAFVTEIAQMYNSNPFHNFEHACHVTMSVVKLLNRIVTPDLEGIKEGGSQKDLALHLHDYTHGIHSDPLLHLCMTFSALIHDVDHRGVSNGQMGKEEPELKDLYQRSIAEQNSVDLAWNALMQDCYKELRRCIFGTRPELLRFRQIIVNVVLATDIFDRELNDLRKARWNKAFFEGSTVSSDFSSSHGENSRSANTSKETVESASDVRATIVIEHIIQASDVSHTMQHWQVYQKWNRALFREMYAAYRSGRMEKNPADFWYQGEVGFFDNYIIPLAKKLKECQIFGVSSDEYLNYALQNRAEWKERGKDIVEEMMKEVAVSVRRVSLMMVPASSFSGLPESPPPERVDRVDTLDESQLIQHHGSIETDLVKDIKAASEELQQMLLDDDTTHQHEDDPVQIE